MRTMHRDLYLRLREAERERFRRLTPTELSALETMILLFGLDRTAAHCGVRGPSLDRVRRRGRVRTATIIIVRDGIERWLAARGEVQ